LIRDKSWGCSSAVLQSTWGWSIYKISSVLDFSWSAAAAAAVIWWWFTQSFNWSVLYNMCVCVFVCFFLFGVTAKNDFTNFEIWYCSSSSLGSFGAAAAAAAEDYSDLYNFIENQSERTSSSATVQIISCWAYKL